MTVLSEAQLWPQLNRALVAKVISELQYEECLQPVGVDEYWHLTLKSGVCYTFCAWKSIWQQLRVNADSLLRDGVNVHSAAQFFIDAKQELELDNIVLANLLEECAQTLVADQQAWRVKQNTSAESMAAMDVDAMQSYLDGHPKAVLNKGRIGWGMDALQAYTPECAQTIVLRWIALPTSVCNVGVVEQGDLLSSVKSAMSERDFHSLQQRLQEHLQQRSSELNADAESWLLIPVHPWQWQHKIQIHFQHWIASGELLDLGQWGYRFLPLQSIRTLANVDHPERPNVKLPLTILNTSCYRGIPGKYIEVGARLSQWLHDLCSTDPLLFDAGTVVLREPVGIFCEHSHYNQIPDSPYRYHEMLGVIWRDSVQSKLRDSERAMLVAGLLQQDNRGDLVLRHLIADSGLSASRWLQALFNAVVVPLYHLMCQYGIGLVAHGQNLTLILENGVPKRLAIKDLQGDLRLVDQEFPELGSLPSDIKSVLTRLPAQYLIHDLQTGHFVTVLRYLSALMQEHSLIHEMEFYEVLANTLKAYKKQFPHLQERHQMFDLLTPKLKRVCINRVRFKEGYGDRQERPLPVLGSDLDNPLFTSAVSLSKEMSL
jgi:aerobactin synthase